MGLLFGESGDSPVKDEDSTLFSMAGRVSSEGSIVSAPEGPEIDERNQVARLEIDVRNRVVKLTSEI